MAYENRRLESEIAWSEVVSPLGSTNDNDALGRTEWSVIDMARDEGPRSANPNAFINRLVSKLFGIAIARPLANDRLESLRRFALAYQECRADVVDVVDYAPTVCSKS